MVSLNPPLAPLAPLARSRRSARGAQSGNIVSEDENLER
jgi:hypothetical protein